MRFCETESFKERVYEFAKAAQLRHLHGRRQDVSQSSMLDGRDRSSRGRRHPWVEHVIALPLATRTTTAGALSLITTRLSDQLAIREHCRTCTTTEDNIHS